MCFAALVVAALSGVAVHAQQVFDYRIPVTSGMLSASSTYDGYTPSTCFDGDLSENHGWCAGAGDRDGWLAIDFGINRMVSRVRVVPDRYIASDPSYSYLDSFHVEIWQGGTWIGASSEIQTPDEVWYPVSINTNTAKLRVVGHTSGSSVQIKQIEIYQAILRPELNVVRDGAALVLSWASLAGYSCQFLSTTNLGAGTWTTNTTLSGTGLWLANAVPIGSESQKFFRVQVEPN